MEQMLVRPGIIVRLYISNCNGIKYQGYSTTRKSASPVFGPRVELANRFRVTRSGFESFFLRQSSNQFTVITRVFSESLEGSVCCPFVTPGIATRFSIRTEAQDPTFLRHPPRYAATRESRRPT